MNWATTSEPSRIKGDCLDTYSLIEYNLFLLENKDTRDPMDKDRKLIVVLITASSAEEGEKIAMSLVDHHLVACVNVVPSIKSFFFWEGKPSQESEVLLIAKSRMPLLDKVIEQVKKIHSYKVPEIIALPVIGGSEEYLKWVEASTS